MDVKNGRGEQHLIIHRGKDRHQVSHTGVYDKTILCTDCDNILGRHEDYAYSLLQACRPQTSEAGKIVTIKELNGDTMVRFAAGIAWKYAVTDPAKGRIDIGPYPAILREVALAGTPIPDSLDVMMGRVIELDGDVYCYRTPMPDRKAGVNVVRFYVGGFLFFLKIDKRRPDQTLPDHWLRGRTSGDFLTIPGEFVEEVQLHRELAGRPSSRKFFQTMRARQAARSSMT